MAEVMRYLDSRTDDAPDYWNPILREDALLMVSAILQVVANCRAVALATLTKGQQ